jgi:2-polyprenyl-3-methyl-5-hydroxy-6-metoxy-1,4-benzoquinol methylase
MSTSRDHERPDPDRLKLYSFQLFTKLEGAVTAGMVHLGDRLGLYRALADAGGGLTSAELASTCGLHERWVREWAYNQAAARLIDVSADERFSIGPEARAVLATPDHPAFGMGMFHRLPQTMRTLEEMPESFRTGVGHDYDSHGPEGAVGIERSFEPWSNANLVPVVLPALDGVVAKLERGATVVDVGCGAGSAVLAMARAFPGSRVSGYDISRYALGRAEQKLVESGLTNVHFHDPRQDPLPSNHTVDLITTFDCIHDMTDPQGMMHILRQAIAPDGTWLLVDIKALDTFHDNVAKNPMASLMYGISVLSCMSSALSEPDGAGLGTLGLPESRARAMAEAAGFTRFRRLDIDHSVNAFYEVRP